MARQALTLQKLGAEATPYDLSVALSSIVAADDIEFDNSSGKVLLLVYNGGTSGAQAATIVSVADQFGRTGDLTITVAQGEYAIVGPLRPSNYNQSDGTVRVDSADEDIFQFAAIQLPDYYPY